MKHKSALNTCEYYIRTSSYTQYQMKDFLRSSISCPRLKTLLYNQRDKYAGGQIGYTL